MSDAELSDRDVIELWGMASVAHRNAGQSRDSRLRGLNLEECDALSDEWNRRYPVGSPDRPLVLGLQVEAPPAPGVPSHFTP